MIKILQSRFIAYWQSGMFFHDANRIKDEGCCHPRSHWRCLLLIGQADEQWQMSRPALRVVVIHLNCCLKRPTRKQDLVHNYFRLPHVRGRQDSQENQSCKENSARQVPGTSRKILPRAEAHQGCCVALCFVK